MEIEIKNFGPISYLKFDLSKDIHLIYGKNAIGKSYATYLIYCFLKTLKQTGRQLELSLIQREKWQSYEAMFAEKLALLKGSERIDITEIARKIILDRLRDAFLPMLQNSLSNTFNSILGLNNQFSKKNFEIRFSRQNRYIKMVISSEENGDLVLGIDWGGLKFEIGKNKPDYLLFSLFMGETTILDHENEVDFVNDVGHHIELIALSWFSLWTDSPIKDIYYLPASRSGLYQALNAFTPIIAELTQNRFFLQNKNIELPSLSEPLADYFIDLSTVDQKYDNRTFEEALDFLQVEILNGEVEYDDKRKKIIFKPKGTNLQLNLSDASSMVSELSPLAIYLKHIFNHKYTGATPLDDFINSHRDPNSQAKGSDILFIEEPEAHLHPEVQVLLVELFAMLSKQGIKIFMTSHSNYMFNKLNNMLIGGELDESKVEVYHLISSPEGTIRNANMMVSKEGIEDENFQETSEKLYMERMALLEAQNDR